jgi:hypothetical protein
VFYPHQPAWYGKGIPTYLIATVTAEKTSAGCTITITRNNYTDAVTPGCCAPPGIGGSTCAGPWGITNNHVGEPWPPRFESCDLTRESGRRMTSRSTFEALGPSSGVVGVTLAL